MKSSRVAVLLVAVAAVIAVATLTGGGDDDPQGDGGSASTAPPAGSIAVTFHYSPEKEVLLAPLIEEFNREGVESGGKPVFVAGTPSSSGDDESKLARKRLQIVALASALSIETKAASIHAGIDEIIMKPMSPRYLVERVLARLAAKPKPEIVRRGLNKRDWSAFGDNVVPLFRQAPQPQA